MTTNVPNLELAVPPGVVIARGIRRVRLERGLTMHAMAGLLGVHTSTVSRIESGETAGARALEDPRDRGPARRAR